ncbi:38795_t:CDS:2 [Gigaspora margarita]|uniref:38795_t:CDS:1 n=1 Tax=Gigaspora margarita TaxID=4874 RepID=A0ABN7UYC6_GIGMA|nr:38795_t:CDS:2 [Gigaspora margarita]
MEEVSKHFTERLNDLDDSCIRDTKKIKTTYANNQNDETERAESSLTLTSNNAKACNQEIISEVMDNNLSTTTNTDLENQGAPIQVLDDNNSHTVDSQTKAWENIEELQQIDYMQTHGYANHNSGTMDIEIEDQLDGNQPRLYSQALIDNKNRQNKEKKVYIQSAQEDEWNKMILERIAKRVNRVFDTTI